MEIDGDEVYQSSAPPGNSLRASVPSTSKVNTTAPKTIISSVPPLISAAGRDQDLRGRSGQASVGVPRLLVPKPTEGTNPETNRRRKRALMKRSTSDSSMPYAIFDMATPTIDTFLTAINKFLHSRDAIQLRGYILVEPPLPEIYATLTSEIRQHFPTGSGDALERKCNASLPEDHNRRPDDEVGTSWSSFVTTMKLYFEYLRDVNVENLLETHQLLSALTNQCITAMTNTGMGLVVLPTCLSLSAALAKLAMALDKRPELTAHLVRRNSVMNTVDDSEVKQSMVEGTAELLQRGFTTCLTDRTPSGTGIGRDRRPEGKKIGIYLFANLVLKLLFQCRKTRLASQIFANVSQHSPPLAIFPASQRVTYLYYLGRFAFSNNHFLRAQKALEAAYGQCHAQALKQRYRILIYLIAVNIILGRFPSQVLLRRADALDLGSHFMPVCVAISKGDLAGLRASLEGDHMRWFLNRGILLPLRNRGEVLAWRSLARKTFKLNGQEGGEGRKAPTFSLQDILALARFLEHRRIHGAVPVNPLPNGQTHPNAMFLFNKVNPYVDAAELQGDPYVDPDFDEVQPDTLASSLPTMLEVESMMASLVSQGLLHGFIGHNTLRFAILGSKHKGALNAGFPNPWSVLQAKALATGQDRLVPGWVQEDSSMTAGRAFGPGMVVNLSGARPAGSPFG